MDILIKVLQFVLSFSLLVIVHELGHFIFARIFGVRVEKFQLFFGKTLVSFKKGDTVYGIGWIPFGGFVKLSGMIDESMDTDYISQPPQPYEFRSKAAWKRLLIMVGGVLMNVVLAFFIYVGMSYKWGDTYLSTEDMKYGYVFNDEAKELGYRDGDRILSINGHHYEDFNDLMMGLIMEPQSDVVVERDGRQVEFRTPAASINKLMESGSFITPRYPFDVAQMPDDSNAAAAGMELGDRLVALNGEPMRFFDQYVSALEGLAGQDVEITVERDSAGVLQRKDFTVLVSPQGKIGAGVDMLSMTPLHTRHYTFWQSFPAGFRRVGSEISGYWKQIKLVFQPKTEAYKSLGGPLSIGNIFPSVWNWEHFWSITALLSIILAVMNILPIPALDGGHVLFLLVEVITGRKPGDKFMIYAQTVGIVLLFALMFFATCNDINRIFIK